MIKHFCEQLKKSMNIAKIHIEMSITFKLTGILFSNCFIVTNFDTSFVFFK